jgi:DNA repair protein RecN (Recombination protein N)
MLQSLSIRDVVLIEKLDLAFEQRGGAGQLAVLTGETGAGKSILIDALGLALGWRAESGLLRRGARQAAVSVAFALPAAHAAHAVLDELGIEAGADLLLRRVLGGDGRSRAFVNDQPVSVALLRRLGDTLVEVQGQLEQHGLLDVATHRDALDAFAGLQARAAATAGAWQHWREAIARQDEAAQSAAQARRDEEWLRHAVAELDGLEPRADEEDQLAAERQLMRHSVALGEAVSGALGDLEHGRGARPRAHRGDRGRGPARGRARRARLRSRPTGEDRGAALRAACARPQARGERARAGRAARHARRAAGGT